MLEIEVAELAQEKANWREKFWKLEQSIKDNNKEADINRRIITAEEQGQWQGKYEGFKEATKLFTKTERQAEYEIDQRIKREEDFRAMKTGRPY